jgi:hypothetical protein
MSRKSVKLFLPSRSHVWITCRQARLLRKRKHVRFISGEPLTIELLERHAKQYLQSVRWTGISDGHVMMGASVNRALERFYVSQDS